MPTHTHCRDCGKPLNPQWLGLTSAVCASCWTKGGLDY